MINNNLFNNMLNNPVRALRGRVELYSGSTLALICGCHDRLREFSVERLGEGKFFGYGVSHKINVKLIDKDRELDLTDADSLEVEFGIDTDYLYPFPKFYITDVYRDELTNELSITAYDALYKAAAHTVAELELNTPYTISEFLTACGRVLNLPISYNNDASFLTEYPSGANFEGTETIREALNAIAEATQTIYYINWDWQLTFKRLSADSEAFPITKDKYYSLDSGDNRRLGTITHATELGDNVSISTTASGSTQYVRDNPFWELREDIDLILTNALAAVGGLTINQFYCEWRGNPLLEIGDRLALTTKDGSTVYSYLLNDTLTFNGSLSQVSEWEYTDNEEESADNPVSLGDALRQTFARVDKANKQIDLVVSDIAANAEAITALQLNTDGIAASVQKIQEDNSTIYEELSGEVVTLTNKVDTAITSEEVDLRISTEIANGVNKVTTETGFTFNEEGLTISKSGTEMTTTITEDGMKVYRDTEEVLIADNEGVKAEDLHATTYLIVGQYSRFEDYGSRTGCFWIGG